MTQPRIDVMSSKFPSRSAQPPLLTAADAESCLSIGLARIVKTRAFDDFPANRQTYLGLLMVFFHLYISGEELTAETVAGVFGHNPRTLSRHVDALVSCSLIVKTTGLNRTGQGQKNYFSFHSDFIAEIVARRVMKRG